MEPMEPMQPQYCFVVGLPRTGTKLMVNVLDGAPNKICYIVPENFFLGRAFLPGVRKRMRRFGDLRCDANVHNLVDAMYSRHFHGEFWDQLNDGRLGVARETLLDALLASDRSDREIYEALLQVGTHDNEAMLLGDKTGPHLYHVSTLLRWFPTAKIVHTFRDPRAILASEHKKRLQQLQYRRHKFYEQGAYLKAALLNLVRPIVSLLIVFYITTAWLRAVQLHYQYQRQYPENYRLSRFEDLVSAPVETVQELCRFLDLEYHPAMLNPPSVDSSFEPRGEAGFDPQTLDRWRQVLSPWMKHWLRHTLGNHLGAFGYRI